MKIVGSKNKSNKMLIIAIASAIAVIAIIVGIVIGVSANKKPEVTTTTTTKPDAPIVGISIDTLPKTEYYVGEEFDKTGLVLKLERADGTFDLIDANDSELLSKFKCEYTAISDFIGTGVYRRTFLCSGSHTCFCVAVILDKLFVIAS